MATPKPPNLTGAEFSLLQKQFKIISTYDTQVLQLNDKSYFYVILLKQLSSAT